MIEQQRLLRLSLVTVVVLGAILETSEAQMPLRGRYVRRDGLFHVERLHWSGGISPLGAQVLVTGITAFAPAADSTADKERARGEKSTKSDRNAPRAAADAEYQQEVLRARRLLAATEHLVDYSSPPPTPQAETPPDGLGQPASEAEFGRNPWKPRPQSASQPPILQGGVPPTSEFGPKSPWKQRPQ